MIPFWSFLLFVACFTVIGYLCGVTMGRWFEHRDQMRAKPKFEKIVIAPTEHRTLTTAAVSEEQRPNARVSRGRMHPRRMRSSKKV